MKSLKTWFTLLILSSCIGILFSFVLLQHNIDSSSTSKIVESVCGVNSEACDTVNRSTASVFMGLPIAFWGLLYYGFIFVLFLFYIKIKDINFVHLIFWLSIGATFIDLSLMLYSLMILGTVCPLCAITYVATLFILIASIAIILNKKNSSNFKINLSVLFTLNSKDILIFTSSLFSVIVIALFSLVLFKNSANSVNLNSPEQLLEKAWESFKNRYEQSVEKIIPTNSSAMYGSEEPVVTIVEFADHLCPHCKIASENLKEIAEKYNKSLRIIYKYYPLDQECNHNIQRPFHIGSCKLSYATHCVQQQNIDLFWKLNKLIFDRQSQYMQPGAITESSIRDLLANVGANVTLTENCMKSPETKKSVESDVELGDALGVTGTPAIFINGRRISGIPITHFVERLLQFEAEKRFGVQK